MRIKKVVIQAFGPFKDKVEIDFEKNNISKGLLLITGDTGSGKTSIFDAICFALYGEASSTSRKVNSLRSDYASPDIDTFVELTFEHNNKNYTVKRSPEYERRSKRGDGTTKQPATAEFEINGRIETKTNAVTKEIEELLGLDYKQFHQISMLSQGEFTKFLLAGSDEKTSIFRKIFNTDIYNLIMYKLKANLNLQEQSFNMIKDNIEKEKSKLSDEYSLFNDKELIKVLDSQIEKNSKEIEELKKKRDTLNEDIKKKQLIFDKINELNNKIIKYKEIKEKLEELFKVNSNIEDERKLIEYNRNVVIEINSILKDIELNEKELKDNTNNNLIKKETLKELDENIKNKEEQFKKLDKYDEEVEKINNEINILNKKLETLNDYDKLYNKLNSIQVDYKNNIEKYTEESQTLLLMQESYYADVAYSIATRLENNKPCPVCGSIEHPSIAEKKLSICSKEELEKQEKIVRELAENKKSYEDQIEIIKNNLKELNFDSNIDVNVETKNIKENIDNSKTKLNELKETNKNLIKEKEELFNNKTKIVTELENIENNIKQYSSNLEEFNKKLDSFLISNKTTLGEYKEKKIDNNDLLLLEVKVKSYDSKKIEYETTLKSLEEVKDKKVENIEEKQIELNKLNEDYKVLDDDYVKNSNELSRIKDIKDNLEKYYKTYQQTYEEYTMIKLLSDTANGKLNGKQKITFENFVQSYYLKNVLVEANKRLLKMTDGQYELKRKESGNLNEKIGLEFSIFDAYTGKERDVSSLSGGEKFKASLALALGLSDVISMFAGGIKMDCLFIDEGFGSLDQESLNQALNTLTDLVDNDKLIGIISHVSELISRIDNKIIVKKDNTGSYIRIEA